MQWNGRGPAQRFQYIRSLALCAENARPTSRLLYKHRGYCYRYTSCQAAGLPFQLYTRPRNTDLIHRARSEIRREKRATCARDILPSFSWRKYPPYFNQAPESLKIIIFHFVISLYSSSIREKLDHWHKCKFES